MTEWLQVREFKTYKLVVGPFWFCWSFLIHGARKNSETTFICPTSTKNEGIAFGFEPIFKIAFPPCILHIYEPKKSTQFSRPDKKSKMARNDKTNTKTSRFQSLGVTLTKTTHAIAISANIYTLLLLQFVHSFEICHFISKVFWSFINIQFTYSTNPDSFNMAQMFEFMSQ